MAALTSCRRCRLVLNSFTHPDGSIEWVHPRLWEEHDHPVEPVPAASVATIHVCDFCGSVESRWWYKGARTMVIAGPIRNGMDANWAACDACDKLIRRNDLEGLLDRHFSLDDAEARRVTENTYSADEIPRMREDVRRLQAVFLSSNPRRSLMPPPPVPPGPLLPTRLPKVRDRLAGYWASEFARREVTGVKPDGEPVILTGVDLGEDVFAKLTWEVSDPVARRFGARMSEGIRAAELYWVSPEFTALAIGAGKKLPDITVTPEEPPAASGLIVYAEPILEKTLDRRDDESPMALVVAVSWMLIPGGVWLTLYAQPEQVRPDLDRAMLREVVGFLAPLAPGAGIPFGTSNKPSANLGSSSWSTLLATWHLMAQPGVATVSDFHLDKKITRTYTRAGQTPPNVRLVDLRRQAAGKAAAGTGHTFSYSVRFVVGGDTGGFWRDQPHGPQRAQRKRIWISPYLKGPADAPLKTSPDVVKVLR